MEFDHEEPKGKSDWTFGRICLSLVNLVNHIMIGFLTIYIIYLGRNLSNNTNLHAVLSTVGYVLLMSEAIVVLAEENLWTNFLSRQVSKYIHWILQVGAAVFIIVGVGVKYDKKENHFLSTHAITGIISVGLIIFVALTGIFALNSVKLRRIIKPVLFKLIHNIFGIGCFVIGMTSLLYGYEKKWMKVNASYEMNLTCVILTYAITVFSLVGALSSLCNQLGIIR
ncbi:uncharacterized protein LOC127290554 [Leptopilina boulardi]|uniref:uncharacterized protein LOC127290554 n=1 Tax=Leptopilina boulardi TaxID=63433 RepID=UPI0021F52D2D|nr:uncharacterized protein LOC127290554 [Leptopilina boulardi]XP_051175185.1 uncharacterized protein LOC127290554 [Leptopilina boulardi]